MRNKFQLMPMHYANEGTVRSDEAERADIRCVEDGCPRPPYQIHPRNNRHPGVPEGLCKFHRDTAIYQTDELARYRAEVERQRRHREWLQFMLTRDDQVCEAEVCDGDAEIVGHRNGDAEIVGHRNSDAEIVAAHA